MSVNISDIEPDLKEMDNFFSKFGLEVIGSKDHNKEKIYLVKKKKKEQ